MKTAVKKAENIVEPEDISGPMMVSIPWTEQERYEIQEFIAKDKENARQKKAHTATGNVAGK